MEALLISTALVTLAELGDKTQLLALLLAARFRRPWPIIAGILLATLANHALAAAVGHWLGNLLDGFWGQLLLALSFVAVALWALVPDRLEEDELPRVSLHGVFMVSLVAFFLAEMGDKTQVATVMLAARFDTWLWVVVGTTLGMLLANVPVVFLGHAAAARLPLRLIRQITALAFLLLGLYAGWLAWHSWVGG